MKNKIFSKEIYKLILFIFIAITSIILGLEMPINKQLFASGLTGLAGSFIALSLAQIKRIITLIKDPDAYNNEEIDKKDERNILIKRYAESYSYNIEQYILLGVIFFALYINNMDIVYTVFILLVIRLASFLYYKSKGEKEF